MAGHAIRIQSGRARLDQHSASKRYQTRNESEFFTWWKLLNKSELMIIVTKLKTDLHEKPYWSAMLINDEEPSNPIMREVVSLTFDLHDRYNKWKEYEKVQNRMAIEIMNEGGKTEQYTIAQMFLRKSQFDKTENRF